jgi:hypothetical protein
MKHLEVNCAVRLIYMSLGAKGLTMNFIIISTATCFDASASSSESPIFYVAYVIKIQHVYAVIWFV